MSKLHGVGIGLAIADYGVIAIALIGGITIIVGGICVVIAALA